MTAMEINSERSAHICVETETQFDIHANGKDMLCVSSGDRAAERKSNYNTFPYASPPSPACCHRRTYWEQKAKTAREEYKKIRARKFPECSPTLQRLPSRDSRAPAAFLQLFFLRIFTRWILNITREVKSLVLV
ncbi:hypothetical protein OUZ56_027058 [Daphnia magna]|uniref:Uncharacterized protein n=1 Tax=Daphnia magna TaxID=35525 RepID=A0ABQ9ZNS4_9CRUS|nr:hypothetical protein OUZ56_027058 [Daphnia magna]